MKKLKLAMLSLLGVFALASVIAYADEDSGRYFSVPAGLFDTAGYLVFAKNTNSLSATQVIYSATINPASIAVNTCVMEAFTVTGIAASDQVSVSAPIFASGVLDSAYGVMSARPSGADTVAITFCNPTAVDVDPGSATYRFFAISSAG